MEPLAAFGEFFSVLIELFITLIVTFIALIRYFIFPLFVLLFEVIFVVISATFAFAIQKLTKQNECDGHEYKYKSFSYYLKENSKNFGLLEQVERIKEHVKSLFASKKMVEEGARKVPFVQTLLAWCVLVLIAIYSGYEFFSGHETKPSLLHGASNLLDGDIKITLGSDSNFEILRDHQQGFRLTYRLPNGKKVEYLCDSLLDKPEEKKREKNEKRFLVRKEGLSLSCAIKNSMWDENPLTENVQPITPDASVKVPKREKKPFVSQIWPFSKKQ